MRSILAERAVLKTVEILYLSTGAQLIRRSQQMQAAFLDPLPWLPNAHIQRGERGCRSSSDTAKKELDSAIEISDCFSTCAEEGMFQSSSGSERSCIDLWRGRVDEVAVTADCRGIASSCKAWALQTAICRGDWG